MSEIFNDGEVLGAFFTLALIIVPMLLVHLYDKAKAKK